MRNWPKSAARASTLRSRSGGGQEFLELATSIRSSTPSPRSECADAFSALPPFEEDYWYKNRFNACHGRTLISEHFEIISGQPVKTAEAAVDSVFMVSMNENSRTADVSVALWNWRVVGNYPVHNPWLFTADCRDIAFGGPSCTPWNVSFSDSIAGWTAAPHRTTTVTFPTDGTPDPLDPSPNEQRQYYMFQTYYELPWSHGWDNYYFAPELYNRCDQARTVVSPQYARGADCVFHEQAGIFGALSVSDPAVAESAQLIRDAQDNPALTKPGTPGTWIPGKYGTGDPLSRLFYDTASSDANRAAAVTKCIEHFGANYTQRNDPNDPTATNDCDEYPFSKTFEGVQLTIDANTSRSYAVRPVHSSHNRTAGSWLGVYMARDHILEEDLYYVTIHD